jgi:hypothetical protein
MELMSCDEEAAQRAAGAGRAAAQRPVFKTADYRGIPGRNFSQA